MASKLKQLQSKAGQASQFLSKHGSAYYKQLMEQNKQFVQEPATVEKCNELSKQLFYTRLARLKTLKTSVECIVCFTFIYVIIINKQVNESLLLFLFLQPPYPKRVILEGTWSCEESMEEQTRFACGTSWNCCFVWDWMLCMVLCWWNCWKGFHNHWLPCLIFF